MDNFQWHYDMLKGDTWKGNMLALYTGWAKKRAT